MEFLKDLVCNTLSFLSFFVFLAVLLVLSVGIPLLWCDPDTTAHKVSSVITLFLLMMVVITTVDGRLG